MIVFVRLGEPFWRVVGERNLAVELPDGASVADLLAWLKRRYPALVGEMEEAPPQLMVDDDAVAGDDHARMAVPLVDGASIYLLWPIAGG